jgi:hypothetical protein
MDTNGMMRTIGCYEIALALFPGRGQSLYGMQVAVIDPWQSSGAVCTMDVDKRVRGLRLAVGNPGKKESA